MEAAQFPRDFIEAVPYRIHTVLTDDGIRFTSRQRDIYDGHDRLRAHPHPVVDATDHARRLKPLRGPTPTEFILNARTKAPDRVRIDPSHLTPGPYTQRAA